LLTVNKQLHPSVTPEVIAEAAKAGIAGVKLYPQGKMVVCLPSTPIRAVSLICLTIGVTTNSESGVAGDFVEAYAPTFAAMEEHGIVLNLHGEVPGTVPTDDVSLEELFLPTLKRLNEKFPNLRIILEVRKGFQSLAGDILILYSIALLQQL